jgi:hypothetical protein
MARFNRQSIPDNFHEFKTLIYEGELSRMAGWAEAYPDEETGGSLFGFWTHSGFPVVHVVTGPGPKSRHGRASFHQDADYLLETGSYLNRTHGLQHIGEWHSHHHMGLDTPSGGDSSTVWQALRRYQLPKFLLCIANLLPAVERRQAPAPCMTNLPPYLGGRYEPAPCLTSLFLDLERGHEPAPKATNLGCFLYTQPHAPYQRGAWVVLPHESPFRCVTHWACVLKHGVPEPQRSTGWEVTRTTLDAPVWKLHRPPTVAEKQWYATPDGQDTLRQIGAELREWFQVCRQSLNASDRAYVAIASGQEEWQIEFPEDFPQSPSILRTPRMAILLDQCTNGQEIRQAISAYMGTLTEREEEYGME